MVRLDGSDKINTLDRRPTVSPGKTPNMIPQTVLDAAKILVDREPIEQVSTAIRTLREHVGLTQDQFAQKLHIQRTTIAQWESGGKSPLTSRTASILRASGLQDQFEQLVPRNERIRLDSKAYRLNDADSLEYDFFVETRGQVLEKVKSFAEQGNVAAARLYMEWMCRNEARIHARTSTTLSLSNEPNSLRQRALSATLGNQRDTNDPSETP